MKVQKIKTLFVYQIYRRGVGEFYKRYIERLREQGFDVDGFCITPNPPMRVYTFSELNSRYKLKDLSLLEMYERLIKKSYNYDALVLFNGGNLHPEILRFLKTFNVYMCFDDPESSVNISQPVAKYFNICMVGNIASLQQYYSWGCKNVFFRPVGFYADYVSENITSNHKRDVNVSIFCERESERRESRLDYLERKIPGLYGRGLGWKRGRVTDREMLSVYSRSKIGINVHNSTGPVNMRTYTLAANGVMEICDNKYFLGHIFKLNKEVIGYNDIHEVPELVEYYLNNNRLREKIALAGYKRAVRDYNETSVWERQMKIIAKYI